MHISWVVLQMWKKMKVKSFSCVQVFVTPWTVAYQALQSMEFSRQEYWSGLPFPFPGDLPNPGIEPGSPSLQADTLPYEPPGKHMWKLSNKCKILADNEHIAPGPGASGLIVPPPGPSCHHHNPCATTLFPHHQPIRESWMIWSSTLWCLLPYVAFKMLCQNPSGSSRLFRAQTTLSPCMALQ